MLGTFSEIKMRPLTLFFTKTPFYFIIALIISCSFLGFRSGIWSGPRENAQLCCVHGGIKAREDIVHHIFSGFFDDFKKVLRQEVFSMNKVWISVFIAAFFEVLWVMGLKYSDNLWTWIATAIAIFISFYLMIMAGQKLPVGTVYAVFVGLGTVGTLLAEIVLFNEAIQTVKLLLILFLLIGVLGLKLVTPEESGDKGVES